MTRRTRYSSLSSFYTDDSRRVRSPERDVGLWWRDDAHGPLHRAAWVSETGELYLVRLGPPEQGGGQVELLATVADRERLERTLRGWRERCGESHSLAWLRKRAAGLDGAARPAREAQRSPLASVGSGAGTMLSAMSSLASELAHQSRPNARKTARSARLSTSRLAPGMSLPAK
ncbi:MAG TPA: hypothetical protein VK761_03630 [Solirubrobacteraceae bacterium]|jgi:hypothetical protein|nr:hypothetical protein [Solirubrobacteraceae bacterium]